MNEAIARLQFAIDGVSELPLLPRDRRSRRFAPVPHGENVLRIIRIRNGIFGPTDSSAGEMAERNFLECLRQNQIAAQQTGDCLSLLLRSRCVKLEPISGIPLPA